MQDYEVTFSRIVTRGLGRKGKERVEVRVTVRATSKADAEDAARTAILDSLPDDWVEILDGMGLISATPDIQQIPPQQRTNSVEFFKHPGTGAVKGPPHKKWRKVG